MEQDKGYIFPMDNALEMVLMFDRMGEISYANAAAKQKLEYGDDLCGSHISDIFPGTFRSAERGFETEFIFGTGTQQLVAYRKNLTCFPVEARIVSNETDCDFYLCMANDILEKEYLTREVDRIRQEADEALKVKSEFVANVTHELRTPVNGILGNVKEMLEREMDEPTEKSLRLTFWIFQSWKQESLPWSRGNFISGIC